MSAAEQHVFESVEPSLFGRLVAISGTSLTLEDIKEMNKSKVYTSSPVVIGFEDGKLKDNAEDLAAIISDVSVSIKDDLPNYSIEKSDKVDTLLAESGKWLSETRKQVTGEFDGTKKRFIAVEKEIFALCEDIKKHKAKLNEAGYKLAEGMLNDYLKEVIDASGFKPEMSLFAAHITNKRKTQCLTATGKSLNSANKKAIDDLVESAVKPMREAKELAEKVNQQHASFSMMASSITTVEGFESLLLQADAAFPDILDHVRREVKNRINGIEAAEAVRIKLEAAEAARIESEALAAEEAAKVLPVVEPVPSAPVEAVVSAPTPEPVQTVVPEPVAPQGQSDGEKLVAYINSVVEFAKSNVPELDSDSAQDIAAKSIAHIESLAARVQAACEASSEAA